jgi:hypothetical protein
MSADIPDTIIALTLPASVPANTAALLDGDERLYNALSCVVNDFILYYLGLYGETIQDDAKAAFVSIVIDNDSSTQELPL